MSAGDDHQVFEFTDAERQWHLEMRGLTTDEHGREILRGLTIDETKFYVERQRQLLNRRLSGNERTPDDQARARALGEKHERARLEALGTEIYLRNENPPRQ